MLELIKVSHLRYDHIVGVVEAQTRLRERLSPKTALTVNSEGVTRLYAPEIIQIANAMDAMAAETSGKNGHKLGEGDILRAAMQVIDIRKPVSKLAAPVSNGVTAPVEVEAAADTVLSIKKEAAATIAIIPTVTVPLTTHPAAIPPPVRPLRIRRPKASMPVESAATTPVPPVKGVSVVAETMTHVESEKPVETLTARQKYALEQKRTKAMPFAPGATVPTGADTTTVDTSSAGPDPAYHPEISVYSMVLSCLQITELIDKSEGRDKRLAMFDELAKDLRVQVHKCTFK